MAHRRHCGLSWGVGAWFLGQNSSCRVKQKEMTAQDSRAPSECSEVETLWGNYRAALLPEVHARLLHRGTAASAASTGLCS